MLEKYVCNIEFVCVCFFTVSEGSSHSTYINLGGSGRLTKDANTHKLKVVYTDGDSCPNGGRYSSVLNLYCHKGQKSLITEVLFYKISVTCQFWLLILFLI